MTDEEIYIKALQAKSLKEKPKVMKKLKIFGIIVLSIAILELLIVLTGGTQKINDFKFESTQGRYWYIGSYDEDDLRYSDYSKMPFSISCRVGEVDEDRANELMNVILEGKPGYVYENRSVDIISSHRFEENNLSVVGVIYKHTWETGSVYAVYDKDSHVFKSIVLYTLHTDRPLEETQENTNVFYKSMMYQGINIGPKNDV